MATTVLPCPKCRTSVHLRDGETRVQCTGCGATVTMWDKTSEPAPVTTGGGDRARQTVLVGSLLILAGGFVALATMRRHRAPPPPVVTPTPIYTAPPKIPVLPTPAGELAWEPNAQAPVITAVNADAVEDVFGFFREWDGLSAWIAYAGAFDGATLKPLWRSEAIDPQLVKQAGVIPAALVAGTRIVVADTSPTLRVYALASGEKQKTLKLAGPVAGMCRSPEQPSRVWVRVVGGGDTLVDLDSTSADLAPRPKWCPLGPNEPAPVAPQGPAPTTGPTAHRRAATPPARTTPTVTACSDAFLNSKVAVAACRAPDRARTDPAPDAFHPAYELTDSTLTVALGTKNDRPFAASQTKAAAWLHGFVTDDTQAKPAAPAVTDLAFGRLYAVYDKVYFDARLTSLDAHTGEALWDVPLVGSLPSIDGEGRGEARGLVTTVARVYVVRAGGGLDIFDAASGKSIGTIGKK